MKYSLLFLLCFFAVLESAFAQPSPPQIRPLMIQRKRVDSCDTSRTTISAVAAQLPQETIEKIVQSRKKQLRLIPNASQPIDTNADNQYLTLARYSADGNPGIELYRPHKDTSVVALVEIEEETLKTFLMRKVFAKYDSVARQVVFPIHTTPVRMRIDSVRNHTEIELFYRQTEPLDSIFNCPRDCFGVVTINNVPVMVYGNAAERYFKRVDLLKRAELYPPRAVFVDCGYRATAQSYVYKEGEIRPLE